MNIKYFGIALLAGGLASCVGDSNSPGLEYMPDMYRSPAAEAYVDYGEVRGVYDQNAADIIEEKFSFVPPNGTIPYVGNGDAANVMMPYQHGAPVGADRTHGLFGVKQDSAGYSNAAADVNPIPFSEDVLAEGEVLFGRFCVHCHGAEGNGDGAVPLTEKFPAPGAYSGPLKDLPAGQIFYSITYGKGAMGSHASQLNKEERWKVVYYVQKLQGKDPAAEALMPNGAELNLEEVIELPVEELQVEPADHNPEH
ncbi:MAG: cytochrome c [Crocinitomicaceae bacterium]